jgi:sigma-54 specific flagellar transcriptional regulator A
VAQAHTAPHAQEPARATWLDPDALPMLPVNGIDLRDFMTRLERNLIQQALDDTNSVVAHAADRLHIRRTTLVEKMRKYGLGRSEASDAL